MLELTWFGNATLKAATGTTSIVFDPFQTRNSSLPPLQEGDLEDVAGILVTHGHFDHCADVPRFARALGKRVFATNVLARELVHRRDLGATDVVEVACERPFRLGALSITPYRATHVRLDAALLATTLLRLGLPSRRRLARRLPAFLAEHLHAPEVSCTAFLVDDGAQSLFHLGSLGLDPGVAYPRGPDLLALPLQGNSRIAWKGLETVERLRPKTVILHHIDDAFPPLSRTIDPRPFMALLHKRFPAIRVFVPWHRVPFVV